MAHEGRGAGGFLPGPRMPPPGAPDWNHVWRIEPAATFGRAWWDNKFTTELSLGLTAWDSRFGDPDPLDRLPFGWGTPVEPALRAFYRL